MAQLLKAPLAYGLSEPVISVTPLAQIIDRVPNGTLQGVLGQLQIFNGTAYMLTGIVAGQSSWVALGGGAGTYATLTVTGNATIGGTLGVTGDTVILGLLAVTGDISTEGAIAADGQVSGGSVVSVGGNVISGQDVLVSGSVYITGDNGGDIAGTTTITNTVNTTQGAGALSIASTNGNAGDNAGFLGFFVGATRVWVPYFDNIAP